MSNLLKKLKQDEPQEFHAVELNSLLTEVTLKTQQSDPKPSFYRYHETINTNADPDRLLMILVNIVKNAQEATKNDGFIDITLSAEKNDSIIEIEDNGEGMSEDFIKHKLFKPFSSTKSGKGMGIGVYQTKEYIESLGGSIAVESEKKQGTKFIIKIPSIKV